MPDKNNKAAKIGKKLVKFFLDLKSELKKVVWPDRKKLIQSTVTVLTICFLMAALVFVIDKVLSGTLNAVGFFPDTSSTAASNILSTNPSSVSVSVSAVSSAADSAASSAAATSQEASSAAASSQG
ncbi:MAG: preprotein translocase subunit SecE [Saccharofermentanales bacterium]